jgi:hypothetical protein
MEELGEGRSWERVWENSCSPRKEEKRSGERDYICGLVGGGGMERKIIVRVWEKGCVGLCIGL